MRIRHGRIIFLISLIICVELHMYMYAAIIIIL